MFDQNQFLNLTPKKVKAVFELLLRHDFRPMVVGGTVRDFFLFKTIGEDWDIELRHENLEFTPKNWSNLGEQLKTFGEVHHLPFSVLRLEISPTLHMEFSPPRVEEHDLNEKHHSKFQAHFSYEYSLEKSFSRRDFTINAMGIEWRSMKELIFHDPFNGQRHLVEKSLYPVSDDFSHDPVRFLRALRFSLKLHFEISEKLKKTLDKMDLSHLTSKYFWDEMQKSKDPFKFLKLVGEEKQNHPELKVPLSEEQLSKLPEIEQILSHPELQVSWLVALEWGSGESEQWAKYFSVGQQSSIQISKWAKETKRFATLFPESYQGEFESIVIMKDFLDLFSWYFLTKKLLQKYPELELLKMIDQYLPHWKHLFHFEAVLDLKHIDPPLRAKYQLWNLCQRI